MLQKGDVVFTRGSKLLHKLIRWGETSPGEDPSLVNHALLVLADSKVFSEPGSATIIESEAHVQAGRLSLLHKGDWFTAYRAINLNDAMKQVICDNALRQLHAKYGWSQLGLQMIDSKIFGGRVVARRLAPLDKHPICSRLVGEAYGEAGYFFGLPPAACDPDSMLDFCLKHADKYRFVISGTL